MDLQCSVFYNKKGIDTLILLHTNIIFKRKIGQLFEKQCTGNHDTERKEHVIDGRDYSGIEYVK